MDCNRWKSEKKFDTKDGVKLTGPWRKFDTFIDRGLMDSWFSVLEKE